MLNKFGADALRWYFYTTSAPWLPSRFSEKAVREGQRKFLGTLQNVYAFFAMYADIDSFDPDRASTSRRVQLSLMDKWILSKLNTLVKRVDADLCELPHHRARAAHSGLCGRAVQLVCPPRPRTLLGQGRCRRTRTPRSPRCIMCW